MKGRNRLIMGSAIGLAALAVAIDHTKHRLPEPMNNDLSAQLLGGADDSPCSLDASPCSLDSPCSLELSPCALDSPCSLDVSPCSL